MKAYQKGSNGGKTVIGELQRMAERYAQLKDPEYIGEFRLSIGSESYLIRLEEKTVEVHEATGSEPVVEATMSLETFRMICDGTWTALTAGGRESWRQPAPLDFKLPPGQSMTPELLQMFYDLSMHFLNVHYPNVYHFGPGHTRVVHGGHVAALAYGHGVRFAYYSVHAGEQINEETDTNSWHQVFACIGGSGVALIDGIEVALHKGIAVHVPPGRTHILRAAGCDELELFWLAYGYGA